jgi:hypothetical protein
MWRYLSSGSLTACVAASALTTIVHMTELRLVFHGSPDQTQVFVGDLRICHVQKVIVTPDGIRVYFPPPALNPSRRFQIERSMSLIRSIPGVLVGHITTDDERTLGILPKRRSKRKRNTLTSKKVSV